MFQERSQVRRRQSVVSVATLLLVVTAVLMVSMVSSAVGETTEVFLSDYDEQQQQQQTPPVFNVYSFGAIGNGVANDTDAIQSALDACLKPLGGCTVWLPDNGTFLSYPIAIRASNTELVIDGELLLPPYENASVYWRQTQDSVYFPFLTFNEMFYDSPNKENLENVTIRGTGRVNGQGQAWWQSTVGNNRPFLFYLSNGINVTLRDLTLYQAPFFHVVPSEVDGMEVYNFTIFTDAGSPNTDGIDPVRSKNIHIWNTRSPTLASLSSSMSHSLVH